MANENIITLDVKNFDAVTAAKDKPVLVDFWAAWCGPCRAVAPILERLAGEYAGRLVVGKLNVDEQQEVAIRFGITGIPTLMVFKGGKAVENLVGMQPYQALKAAVDRHI